MKLNKRPHATALAEAMRLRAMFSPDCYARWEFAGSIRRNKPEVGDVEHVVLPKFTEQASGLFATEPVNLFWRRLDQLLESGEIAKHTYLVNKADGTVGERNMWGERYRGVDFNGFNHEFFLATHDNWGAILLIRTGPAEYSERVVTQIKQGGMYRQQEGKLVHVASGATVPVVNEKAYLAIAGMNYLEPNVRR